MRTSFDGPHFWTGNELMTRSINKYKHHYKDDQSPSNMRCVSTMENSTQARRACPEFLQWKAESITWRVRVLFLRDRKMYRERAVYSNKMRVYILKSSATISKLCCKTKRAEINVDILDLGRELYHDEDHYLHAKMTKTIVMWGCRNSSTHAMITAVKVLDRNAKKTMIWRRHFFFKK